MPRLATKGSCLLTWIIHETSYLTVIVEALYKSRPTMVIIDSLSRLARQENQLDKLPPKVAELIRKEIPFAVLLPLSLLTKLKELVKPASTNPFIKKRLNMKLIITTSLGQGWLINHPECRVDTPHMLCFSQLAQQMSCFIIKAQKPFIIGYNPNQAQRYAQITGQW